MVPVSGWFMSSAAGAFADLTADKSQFPNSSTWLKGLQDSTTYDGKLPAIAIVGSERAENGVVPEDAVLRAAAPILERLTQS